MSSTALLGLNGAFQPSTCAEFRGALYALSRLMRNLLFSHRNACVLAATPADRGLSAVAHRKLAATRDDLQSRLDYSNPEAIS